MNVFRQHRERTLAESAARKSADQATSEGSVEGSIYEKMFAQLNAHKIELKAIKSVKTKGVRKGEFLDDYAAYVEGILAANEPVQDDVVMTIFVWALDAENIELALSIAEWALAHDIAPPPDFKRSVASILAEEMAELALSDIEFISEYSDYLETVSEMVAEKDMADPVRAKLLKAIGYAKRDDAPEEALSLLKEAIELHPKIGVKRDIETIERQFKNAAEAKAKEEAAAQAKADKETKAAADAKAKEEAAKAKAEQDAADAKAKETPPVSPAPVLATETNVTESNQVTIESDSEADGDVKDAAENAAQEDESE